MNRINIAPRAQPPSSAYDFSQAAPHNFDRPNALLVASVIVVLSAAVRLPGLFTDAWIDEVWSHSIASQCTRFRDILFSGSARIDNNHPLITLWMFLLGPAAPLWLLRVPSLLAGVGTALLAWRIAQRESSRAVAILATAILAFAFPFVFYASEARGYAMAAFFALLAYDALRRAIDASSTGAIVLFNIAALGGMLSHLTFLPLLAALVVGGLVLIRRGRPLDRTVRLGLALFAMPIAAAFALNHFFISKLVIGGAAPTDPLWTLFQSISLIVGGPMNGAFTIFAAVVVASLIVAAQVQRVRRGNVPRVMLDALALIVMPGFLLVYNLVVSQRPQPLMPRYFLVPMAFASFAVAEGIALLLGHRIGRIAAGLLGMVVLLANCLHARDAYLHGRGRSVDALRHMLATSSASPVTIGSDNEFPVRSVIEFDVAAHPELSRVRFESKAAAPDFWISTSLTRPAPGGFTLDAVAPAGELSGTGWWIYRRR